MEGDKVSECMQDNGWIPEEEWNIVVKNIPIVSVDLIVLHKGGLLLGRRSNEPAKGEWFVPGGRLRKCERLKDAVHRIAKKELGTEVEIREMLAIYEHFYNTSDVPNASKHYVAIGFVVTLLHEEFAPDNQHTEFRVFRNRDGLHPYVKQYLADVSKTIPLEMNLDTNAWGIK